MTNYPSLVSSLVSSWWTRRVLGAVHTPNLNSLCCPSRRQWKVAEINHAPFSCPATIDVGLCGVTRSRYSCPCVSTVLVVRCCVVIKLFKFTIIPFNYERCASPGGTRISKRLSHIVHNSIMTLLRTTEFTLLPCVDGKGCRLDLCVNFNKSTENKNILAHIKFERIIPLPVTITTECQWEFKDQLLRQLKCDKVNVWLTLNPICRGGRARVRKRVFCIQRA